MKFGDMTARRLLGPLTITSRDCGRKSNLTRPSPGTLLPFTESAIASSNNPRYRHGVMRSVPPCGAVVLTSYHDVIVSQTASVHRNEEANLLLSSSLQLFAI